MNSLSFDLNLIPVLDALLRERHVTRASERLGQSQPTTSAALARLRALLGDQLLERDGNQMRLTQKAIELREPVAAVLLAIERLFEDADPFDPTTSSETFRLSGGDYAIAMLMAPLMTLIQEAGTNISIECSPLGQLQQRLDDDRIDFALGLFDNLPRRFRRQVLFTENYVSVMRRGHPALVGVPAGQPLPLDSYLGYRHVVVSAKLDDRSLLVRTLANVGRERTVGCTVNEFLGVPAILQGTDLLGTVPERLLAQAGGPLVELESRPLPVELPAHTFELIWHQRKDEVAAHKWIREAIVSVCAGLQEPKLGQELRRTASQSR